MEGDEVGELKEQAEKGGESALRPVAFTMSVLAVLVAVSTVLGHRTHTEAVLYQNKATDQWNEYQAKKNRSDNTRHSDEVLSIMVVTDKDKAAKILKDDADHQAKWTDDLKEAEAKARELEEDVEKAEVRANHFDLGEAMLEIGLVVTSVTLLTRSKIYWYVGFVFALAGIVSASLAFLP
jgi:hypothetical protein